MYEAGPWVRPGAWLCEWLSLVRGGLAVRYRANAWIPLSQYRADRDSGWGCLFEWFDVGLECLRFVLSVAKLVSNALKPRFFTTFCLYKKSGDISNVLGS